MTALFAELEPDGFTTESPTRAFSDWDAGTHYAIGKGFRPSLGPIWTRWKRKRAGNSFSCWRPRLVSQHLYLGRYDRDTVD